jgi:hypothetical protein
MNNTITLAFLCADDRAGVFSDDERVTDHEPYFDDYAFQVWNDQEHNEYDGTLAQLIWANYQTPNNDKSNPDDRCNCHITRRVCASCWNR